MKPSLGRCYIWSDFFHPQGNASKDTLMCLSKDNWHVLLGHGTFLLLQHDIRCKSNSCLDSHHASQDQTDDDRQEGAIDSISFYCLKNNSIKLLKSHISVMLVYLFETNNTDTNCTLKNLHPKTDWRRTEVVKGNRSMYIKIVHTHIQ